MPTAFITGASGQDGSYLVDRLLQKGWIVHALVKPQSTPGPISVPQSVRLHESDVSDQRRMADILLDVQPDALFNLAGVSSVAKSWECPVDVLSTNAVATTGLLEVVSRIQDISGTPVKFIQASSAELFGGTAEVPQTERTSICPISPYGASKALAHHMVGVYRRRGVFASSAILYNHESPRRPQSFVTRKITSQVARIALGIDSQLLLGNLDAKRDWGWAPDYVEALVLMAEHELPDDFVIATGVSHTVAEFVSCAFEAAGLHEWEKYTAVDSRFVRPVDAAELRGDSSKARKELGWEPTMGFEEIVARMVANDLEIEGRKAGLL
ncbi:GDP-mannose 4,6 dehydratase 2 [Pseudarthrobacter siccitolerans]|uniref:GDP-mannose 4,6-dehydratase n=2 Tax=Pseudarthrobacter siccitolerans TaxID=861266 RepID=A0A024GZ52_9MICC|nr:GDP-mannose 4,6 dehydratase 2 [Pseudarthrobacter siccitolerans]